MQPVRQFDQGRSGALLDFSKVNAQFLIVQTRTFAEQRNSLHHLGGNAILFNQALAAIGKKFPAVLQNIMEKRRRQCDIVVDSVTDQGRTNLQRMCKIGHSVFAVLPIMEFPGYRQSKHGLGQSSAHGIPFNKHIGFNILHGVLLAIVVVHVKCHFLCHFSFPPLP